MTLRRCRAQAPLREAPERAMCPVCLGARCVRDAQTREWKPCRYCGELGEIGVEAQTESDGDGDSNGG